MKRLFCLVAILGLAACDRSEYDIQLVCGDGAGGDLLVDMSVYETHADMGIRRLGWGDRFARARQNDHITWLSDQLPRIDDEITIRLPIAEEVAERHQRLYEIPDKFGIKFERDMITGGIVFDMMYSVRGMPSAWRTASCDPVIRPIDMYPRDIGAAKRTELKNCIFYIQDTMTYQESDTNDIYYADTDEGTYAYNADLDGYVYISPAARREIFGGIDVRDFTIYQLVHGNRDILNACDVAARLREYIENSPQTGRVAQPDDDADAM